MIFFITAYKLNYLSLPIVIFTVNVVKAIIEGHVGPILGKVNFCLFNFTLFI